MFVKLVFPIPVNNFYYYSVPDEFAGRVDIGHRVKVNFNNRDTYGYVIDKKEEIESDIALEEIKPVLGLIDDGPIFTENILKLAFWISSYYFASTGEVLKIMTPTGLKAKEYLFDKVWRKDKEVVLTEKQQEVFDALRKLSIPDYALIYGITGSGKTEIYLSLIEEFIKKKSRLFTLCRKFLLRNS